MAQRLTHKIGRFDQISVAASKGVSASALKDRIAREVPAGVRVETAKEKADRGSEEIRENLTFLRIFLLVFAFIAILVGSFLIFNTFSITVAQRVSEFGLLRTLGASRGQILTDVVAEAMAVGLLGAVLGIGGGFLVAMLLNALLEAFEVDLPTTSLVMESRTIVVSLLVGIVVTVLSALVPAIRSTRVPPLAALRAAPPATSRRRRLLGAVASLLVGVAGLAMVLIGLFGGASAGTAAGLIGGGAVAMVFAVSLFSPRLVGPLATVAGWPLERMRRLLGRLARENAQRNPSRTAVTAAALMIGLTVVAFVTVFAAGLKSSVAQVVDENFAGGLVIQNSDGFSPIPAGAARTARKVPGVEAVATIRREQAKLLPGGSGVKVSASSRDVAAAGRDRMEAGSPGHPAPAARRPGRRLRGLRLRPRARSRRPLPPAQPDPPPTELRSRRRVRLQARSVRQRPDHAGDDGSRVRPEAGHDRLRPGCARRRPARTQALLTKGVETAFPVAEVLNQQELKESREEQVDQLVNLVYALLLLAIVVSLFGIANTLALSIHERTRELGMLRAIGMSRRQVRTMIRYEAVITALIGAILGMALGLVFAALIAQPLKDEGFTLSYPVGSLIGLLVFAALIGVLAAIPPARRASRLDVLESLQYE